MVYYEKKYPYLSYRGLHPSGAWFTMYSIPARGLFEMYGARMGEKPRSFFDCGAATGKIMAQAEELGVKAEGIDIFEYPHICSSDNVDFERMHAGKKVVVFAGDMPEEFRPLPQKDKIEIVSLLERKEPVTADLVYCNGTLTYFNEKNIDAALGRFLSAKMLIAIHDTKEDVKAAQKMGEVLHPAETRMIKSRSWWMKRFEGAGFDVDFDGKYGCFCAVTRGR